MPKEQSLKNNFIYWIEKTIKDIKQNKKILVEKTQELADKLMSLMSKKSSYKKEFYEIEFFIHFIDIFFNRIFADEKKQNITTNLISSQLRKFSYVFWLYVNEEYESSMILFRSLYEGLVVTLFLLKNEICIEKYACSSAYKIFTIFDKTNLQEVHNELMNISDSKLIESLDKMGLKKYDPKDLLARYGWAKEGIKGGNEKIEIEFTDVLENVFPDENYKVMYRIASSFVHSTMAGTSMEIIENLVKDFMLSYINNFCIPVFVDISVKYLLVDKSIEQYVFENVWKMVKKDNTAHNKR